MSGIEISRKGTIDLYIVEANPVCFKGRLYIFEYIRCRKDASGRIVKTHRDNRTGDSCFRLLEPETGWTSPSFGRGLHMGNAFVWNDRMYVTAVEDWGKSRFYQLESDDLIHWTEPRVILEDPRWAGYNTSVCRDDQGFLMTFELGKPADLVGVPFTMFFARSTDLKNWTVIPDAVFGKEIYTGGPMLRYFAPWYYFFYLDGSYERGFREFAARSRDLKHWEWSPQNPVMAPGDEDRQLNGRFSEAEKELIRNAVNINNSDLDMCEWQGKLYLVYSWGDQRGTEFLATAEAPGTEKEFCLSFFENQSAGRKAS